MNKTPVVTFLAVTVLSLVSAVFNTALAASNSKKAQIYTNNKSVMSADRPEKDEAIKEPAAFGAVFIASRSTSLVDFNDGSRKDGMDYLFIPSATTYFGSFSAKIAYSQNIRGEQTASVKENSDWADIPFKFAFNPTKWFWAPPYVVTATPTITAVLPMSQISIKRDQLQSNLIAGFSLAISPDGLAPKKDGAWNLALGVTAGRSFHPYEENINGDVLNKYSSNQTLNLGYTYKSYSISTEYIHKTRWTYQSNVRDAFELSEEIGYEINDHFSVALGHTNSGSGLKEDGSETNFKFINENDSTVYVQMGVSF